MKPAILHKYTSTNALEGILRNRTIRFSRFDTLDNRSKETTFKKLKLAQFLFTSSWTMSATESIPMWDRYGDKGTGVKIGLPRKMFKWRPIEIPNSIHPQGGRSFESPLAFDQIFGERHLVLPMFLNEQHFERQVVYDSDIKSIKNKAIDFRLNANETVEGCIRKPARIASVKKPIWSYQEEYRFVLMIMPSPQLKHDPDFFPNLGKVLPGYVATYLMHGIGPGIAYFDVPISQSALDRMVVMLGPSATNHSCSLVQSLVERFTPKAKVVQSELKDDIRSYPSTSLLGLRRS